MVNNQENIYDKNNEEAEEEIPANDDVDTLFHSDSVVASEGLLRQRKNIHILDTTDEGGDSDGSEKVEPRKKKIKTVASQKKIKNKHHPVKKSTKSIDPYKKKIDKMLKMIQDVQTDVKVYALVRTNVLTLKNLTVLHCLWKHLLMLKILKRN